MRERTQPPRLTLQTRAESVRRCPLSRWLADVRALADEGLNGDERLRIEAAAVLLSLKAPPLPMARAFDMGEVNEYDG